MRGKEKAQTLSWSVRLLSVLQLAVSETVPEMRHPKPWRGHIAEPTPIISFFLNHNSQPYRGPGASLTSHNTPLHLELRRTMGRGGVAQALPEIPGGQSGAWDWDTGKGGKMLCVRHCYRHLEYNSDLNRQILTHR